MRATAAGGAIALMIAAGSAAGFQDVTPPPAPPPADAPAEPPPSLASFEGRLIRDVILIGIEDEATRGLVMNQLSSRAGTPLSYETVQVDIRKFNGLGHFKRITADVQPFADQSVALVYEFEPTPVVQDVQAVGNRQVSDGDLAKVINILRGTAVDQYQLDRARREIKELYRKKGYYLAEVEVDQTELEETGIVLFRIREGERVRVTDIRFDGNETFPSGQIRREVKTKTAGLLEKAPLQEDVLDQDVDAVIGFYQDRGYLDVRADRQVRFSPNGKEAIVTFLIDEGPLYTLRSVRAVAADATGRSDGGPPTVFSSEQVAGLLTIKPGGVYSVNEIRKSIAALTDAYGRMGYIDAAVDRSELRDDDEPLVDLLLIIREGERSFTGLITVSGNDITQDRVIRREFRQLQPDRPLNAVELRETKERLEATRLFAPGQVKLTIQHEDPTNPGYRDVLATIEETNTGSIGFAVGVNSDAGVAGTISLTQRNFDLLDTPDSASELFSGRAFRGAAQTFELSASPGTEISTYSLSLSDPALLDSDYSGSIAGYYTTRIFNQYNVDRLGARLSFGRRFGERWTATLLTRFEGVELSEIDGDAPTDVFADEGDKILDSIGLRLTRTTTNSRIRPTRGTRTELGLEQFGLLSGDYDFTRLTAEHTLFLPVYESFLGYTTVLSLRGSMGYIIQDKDEVPVYERFYLGGRSLRGFAYRTVSPKGIRNDTMEPSDDPIGGTWSFLFSAELEHPVYEDNLAVVVFSDTGTVLTDPGFDDMRWGVGVGIRLYIPQLGPAPLAFDFGFPIIKQDGDETRIFTFSIDLPF